MESANVNILKEFRGLSIKILKKTPMEIEWDVDKVLDFRYVLLMTQEIQNSIKSSAIKTK